MKKISFIGFGKFGFALYKALLKNKNISFFCFFKDTKGLNDAKILYKNETSNTIFSTDLDEVIKDCDILFLTLPSSTIGDFLTQNNLKLSPKTKVIICSKGIGYNKSKMQFFFYSELLKSVTSKDNIFVLSGPNFAVEIAEGVYTATDVSGYSSKHKKEVVSIFKKTNIDVNYNKDIHALQFWGAYKNIIAIMIGFFNAINKNLLLDVYENSKNSFIVQVFQEAQMLSKYFHCKSKDFISLSGIGDIMLTSFSLKSRNSSFGNSFAKSVSFDLIDNKKAIQELKTKDFYYFMQKYVLTKERSLNFNELAEGVYAIENFYNFCIQKNIKTKYLASFYKLIFPQ